MNRVRTGVVDRAEKKAPGFKAGGRKVRHTADSFELRETLAPYGPTDPLETGNSFLWNQ
jgi:hypothetical protein